MPISITNRTEKGSELTTVEMDAILEALAAALGVVVSSSTPANEDCPFWLDTTNPTSPTLKTWNGSSWTSSGADSDGAKIYLMQKHRAT